MTVQREEDGRAGVPAHAASAAPMTKEEWCARIIRVFSENGMAELIDAGRAERLYDFCTFLLTENEKYNLTAIRDPGEAILRHFADSVAASGLIPRGAQVLDVGCGGGFPSVPLAVCRPDLTVTALDATAKKVRFVEQAAARIGAVNLTARVGRAEELARDPALRERFDAVTARAVAELRVLAELCLPFVRVGGVFVALKGSRAAEEEAAASAAVQTLGGRDEGIRSLILKEQGREPLSHAALCIRKVRSSPQAYPRAYAQIRKKPL